MRSTLFRLATQLLLAVIIGGMGLFLGRGGPALAATFNPTETITVVPTTLNTAADTTIVLDFPSGDSDWADMFLFTPSGAFIAPGPGHPLHNSSIHPQTGVTVGSITADLNLGLVNSTCNVNLLVPWTLTNETVQIGSMPAYVETIFDPGSGTVQPLARYEGSSIVSGETFEWQLVVFEPGDLNGAFSAPHPYGADFTTAMGYPMAIILANPDDPVGPPTANAVTDQCTPEQIVIDLSGQASDFRDRYRNPSAAGTYVWKMWYQSFRDADNDGIENPFDTCPFTANTDGDPRTTAGPDGDMLDSACDPIPSPPTPGAIDPNQDGDSQGAIALLNAGDNCPLAFNPPQTDSDLWPPVDGGPRDHIGDACDPNPATSDTEGLYHVVDPPRAICIGGTDADGDGWCATDDPNDASALITPENYSYFNPMPVAHSGAGGGLAANPASNSNAGQPYQLCNDGLDNDGDTLTDLDDQGCNPVGLPTHPGHPACPANGCDVDSDGDGFTDEAEINIGTDALGRCGNGPEPISLQWPLDLDGDGLLPIGSVDRITITDITAFLVPRRIGTSPGHPDYDPRFDLVPGQTFPFTTWIAVNDLITLIAGPQGYPPMFNGVRAYGGPVCSPHPNWGD